MTKNNSKIRAMSISLTEDEIQKCMLEGTDGLRDIFEEAGLIEVYNAQNLEDDMFFTAYLNDDQIEALDATGRVDMVEDHKIQIQ